MKKRKLLLIDDEDDFRDALGQIIKNYGYKVYEFSSYKNNESIINNKDFDIAILDYYLKEENGLEIANKLIEKEKINIKSIVIISSEDQIKEKAKKIGVKYFFSKPIDFEKFLNNLDSI